MARQVVSQFVSEFHRCTLFFFWRRGYFSSVITADKVRQDLGGPCCWAGPAVCCGAPWPWSLPPSPPSTPAWWTLTDPAGAFLEPRDSPPLLPRCLSFLLGLLRAGARLTIGGGGFCKPVHRFELSSLLLTELQLRLETCIWFKEGKPGGFQRCDYGCSLLNLFTSENIFFLECMRKPVAFVLPLTSWLIFTDKVSVTKSTPCKQWKEISYWWLKPFYCLELVLLYWF